LLAIDGHVSLVGMPDPPVLTPEDLRSIYPGASERSQRKEIDHMDGYCRRFIALSPFCVLSTVGPGAAPDLTPRGGEPGFVRVTDERTLVLPDRPGNYRLDNITNLVARPSVALLFMVPGIDETLRVYGQGEVVRLDARRRVGLGVDAKTRTALDVKVDRAFFHCAKALMRAQLWDPARRVERSEFPTMGEVISRHSGMAGPAETQAAMVARYQAGL